MAHIHLCWELGGALGHAGRLKSLALALLARGHRVTLALRDLVQTRALLADLDVPKFQSPLLLQRVAGLPPDEASLAEVLLGCGYIDAGAVAGLVDGWRALFGALRPDLVVCDYAPSAVLAARSLGLRSASVGLGYYMPPAGQPLPPFRDWEPAPRQRLQAAEARVLASANAVLARHGARPLAHAAELLLGDAPLLCTWPELDHYARPEPGARWYGPNLSPPAGEAPAWPEGAGPRVFAYVRGVHPGHAAMLQALADEGCRTLCYLPDVVAGKLAPVASPLVRYARAPVALAAALAEAQLAVSHGGEGTVAQALLAGVPQLLMPHTAETFLAARRVHQLGAGINASQTARPHDWRRLVRSLLTEPGYRAAAAACAQRRRGFSPSRQASELADAFERELARVGSEPQRPGARAAS
jgi:UDP:flavonoid glycosyltransferase YjiC (YdhE family)